MNKKSPFYLVQEGEKPHPESVKRFILNLSEHENPAENVKMHADGIVTFRSTINTGFCDLNLKC